MKKKIVVFLLLCSLLNLVGCQSSSSVSQLDPFPASMDILPGVSVQLTVKGYTEHGDPAEEEAMDQLHLRWDYQSDDGAFAVDENGYCTAISAGSGTAWVQSEDGTLCSCPIEISVKES